MCVVAIKYLKDHGWIGVKNRDRHYKADVEVVQSNRHGVQRLYIDFKLSRVSEGVNEYGVSIFSASFALKCDVKIGDKLLLCRKNQRNQHGQ